MIQSALICVLVYAVLQTIDTTFISFQCVTRPIVAAPITGLLLGDLQTGIIMGAALESIFMGISAIGGSIPADGFTSSIIAVAMAVLTNSDIETGLAIAMPIGTLMASVGSMFTPIYASLAPYWENLAASGKTKSFTTQVLGFDILFARLPAMIILFLAVAFGVEGLQSALAVMPGWVMSGLGAASSMMTAVGFAILTSMIWSKEVGGFFFVGFVMAKYLGLGTLPIAILLAVVALMYFYNDKKLLDAKNSGAIKTAAEADSEEDFF